MASAVLKKLVLFEWTPSRRKEVGIPLAISLTSGNRTNVPTSLGRVNPNIAAAGNRTWRLAQHQAATRTQADWNSVCPRRNPGVRTAPGWTPGIVRTLCRPFRAFRWFPIHKPSSNSIVPVAWITEPAMDSRWLVQFIRMANLKYIALCKCCSSEYWFSIYILLKYF